VKILLVDNYDSFTYNLLHYLEGESLAAVDVKRNDELQGLVVDSYTHIVISPGPGLPEEAGKLKEFISSIQDKKVLGVCLGQQAIAEVFDSSLSQLEKVVHGQSQEIKIIDREEPIYFGLPDQFKVGRYHSWVVDSENLNSSIKVTAVDEEGNIMSIRHRDLDIAAVQFHPESILTEHGRKMIRNWIRGSDA